MIGTVHQTVYRNRPKLVPTRPSFRGEMPTGSNNRVPIREAKMIDFASEDLLTLSQAADELPRRRRGRKTHVSTLYRWATAGCRGERLETVQIGATRCTSREA